MTATATSVAISDRSPSIAVDADARRVLLLSTAAFTMLFAVWLMFGVLGKPIRQELSLSAGQMYWLGAAAVFAGSLFRLPFGIIAERFGGRSCMIALLLWTAVPTLLVSFAHGYGQLLALALLFGVAGNAFSVGIAWNAAWFPPARKGLAMGVFGAGNVGASVTKLVGPALIATLPAAGLLGGLIPGGWRAIPVFYAIGLVAMAAAVWAWTPAQDRTPAGSRPVRDMLKPLRETRVWRFGLYYVVVFGAYVAWSIWLPSYFQEVHGCSLAMAGVLTALFIFPASLLRPLGGWLSDIYGARAVTYGAFIGMLVLSIPLAFSGPNDLDLPLWAVVLLIILIGVGMGVGKASVYRYIPEYYPQDVGAVGGLVGTLGALGGVVLLPAFGWIESAGIRTSAFLLLGLLIGGCLLWLQIIINQLKEQARKRELDARQAATEAAYAAEDERRLGERRRQAEAAGAALDGFGHAPLPAIPAVAAIRNAPLFELIGVKAQPGEQPRSLRIGHAAWHTATGAEAALPALLAGCARPAGGSVCFREREIDGPGPDRPLVGAGDPLVAWRSVEANIVMAVTDGDPAGSAADRGVRAKRSLDAFGIADCADLNPRALSPAKRCLAAIARAHALQPDLLLLDDPTADLDEADAMLVLSAVAAAQRSLGFAVVWSTRDTVLAGRFPTRA